MREGLHSSEQEDRKRGSLKVAWGKEVEPAERKVLST